MRRMGPPRRMVIVGEGPSPRFYEAPTVHALYGGPASRLGLAADWCRTGDSHKKAYQELLRHAWLLNVCRGPWVKEEAVTRAASIRAQFRDGVFVLLGRRVASAFRHPYPTYRLVTDGVKAAVVVPHPSGLNRVWNDPKTWEKTGRTLREAYQLSLHGWS